MALIQRARPVHAAIELTADHEHRVANHFAFKPARRASPQQLILRVDLRIADIKRCRLRVRRAGHDEFVHGLERPLAADQFRGEEIQQQRMRRNTRSKLS